MSLCSCDLGVSESIQAGLLFCTRHNNKEKSRLWNSEKFIAHRCCTRTSKPHVGLFAATTLGHFNMAAYGTDSGGLERLGSQFTPRSFRCLLRSWNWLKVCVVLVEMKCQHPSSRSSVTAGVKPHNTLSRRGGLSGERAGMKVCCCDRCLSFFRESHLKSICHCQMSASVHGFNTSIKRDLTS